MSLDIRYIPIFTLQDVLVNKTSGNLLSGGFVSFYRDVSRNTPKQVYMISGTPPNYQYTAIGTQLVLSSVGTFVDGSGNDIVPYLFPYDGDAATTTNTLDLYYITVTDSGGIPQFTREGVPNLEQDSNPANTVENNFVHNGQLLLHNDHSPVPGSETLAYGGTYGTTEITNVAPGGFTYERKSGSTAVDTITFTRPEGSNQLIGNVSGSPRYAINISRSVGAASAEVCTLGIKFMDANKFAGQELTLLFNAMLNSGTSLGNIILNEVDYYGTSNSTSGSPAPGTTVVTQQGGALTFTNVQTQFAVNFTAALNQGSIIGTDNNDFVMFAIQFPSTETFDIQLTDFLLVEGNANGNGETSYPITTNGEFILGALSELAQTTSNPTNSSPPYYPQDGSNLYLPVIMTQKGFTYDYSVVGQIESNFAKSSFASTAKYPSFLCDGSSKVYTDYTNTGVPQSRLGDFLIQNSSVANVPMFGTGSNYATAYAYSAPTNAIRISVNTAGTNNTASDGASATAFTFTNIHTGVASYTYNVSNTVANTIICIGSFTSPLAPASAGTSGFTITTLAFDNSLLAQQAYAFTLQAVSAAALATGIGIAGKYFDFSNASVSYRFWFKINGEIAPAAGGNTLVQIDLSNTATAGAQDVANIIRESMSAYQDTSIVVGALPPAGSYFNFQSNSGANNYFVWYQIAGIPTTAPSGTGTGIKVVLGGTETNAQIASKTLIAINKYQYAVPNLEGIFLRGLESSAVWDLDLAQRLSHVSGISGANLGTYEYSQLLQHNHAVTVPTVDSIGSAPFNAERGSNTAASGTLSATVGLTGGSETRPANVAVNFFIRY